MSVAPGDYHYNPLHAQESVDPRCLTWHHGHRAYYSAHEPPGWDPEVAVQRWADTGELVEYRPRPCAACGLVFRPCDQEDCRDEFEGTTWVATHDPCLGHLAPGEYGDVVGRVESACCGHGVEEGYVIVAVRIPLPRRGVVTPALLDGEADA